MDRSKAYARVRSNLQIDATKLVNDYNVKHADGRWLQDEPRNVTYNQMSIGYFLATIHHASQVSTNANKACDRSAMPIQAAAQEVRQYRVDVH